MSKHDLENSQMHVLGVSRGCKCDGCEKKIKKLLQKIKGVRDTSVDMEQGKVTVTGNVEPDLLIKKLEQSGKHAEIWGSQKGFTVFSNKNTGQFDAVSNNQLKDLQMSNNGKKSEVKNSEKDPQKQTAFQQLIQEMNTSKDLKPPVKVKDDADDGDFDGDDEGYDYDDDGKKPQQQKKVVHVRFTGEEKAAGNPKKPAGGKRMMNMIGKAIGGKTEGKDGTSGKKSGGGGIEGNIKTGGEGKTGNFEVIDRHSAGKLPVAHGAAAIPVMGMNGGGGPGGGVGPMGPVQGPYQQPQYTATMNQPGMMMNNGGDMHQPPMYGRPAYGYAPPPAHDDPVTDIFSDENPHSCNIM